MPLPFPLPPRERLLRWGRNALIVSVLILLALDGIPVVPPKIAAAVNPIVRTLGIWQTHWALFSPMPDHKNHKFVARLHYADGVTEEWHSPDWRAMSDWDHFRTHRVAKYYDNIHDPGYAAAWPAFTELILREHAANGGRNERPTKIEVRLWEGLVPDARYRPWAPAAAPREYDNRWTLYETESP